MRFGKPELRQHLADRRPDPHDPHLVDERVDAHHEIELAQLLLEFVLLRCFNPL